MGCRQVVPAAAAAPRAIIWGARMGFEKPSRLDESGPRVGLMILFDGQEWQVTGQATYSTEQGYRVHEWACEADDTTAYLLKEADATQGSIRWFFTREIPTEAVAVAGGEGLEAWVQRNPGAHPPAALTYRGDTYRYEETTEGTHEDASGQRARKVTWDYWDDRHAHNLAVEVWPDGSFDCSHGAYIDPAQVTIRAGAAAKGSRGRLAANPFLAAGVFLPVAYLLAFIAGRPFDESIAFALPAAAVGAWLLALPLAPAASLAALVAAIAAIPVFWRFPPLTSGLGLLALFGAPAAIGWVARNRRFAGHTLTIFFAAAFGVAMPLLIVGLHHYFRLAPGPHTADQFALALGPAVLGGLAACLVARVILGKEERGAP